MKTMAFTYDFPHRKSCEGMGVMIEAGQTPELIIAQEKKVLKHSPSAPFPSKRWNIHPKATARKYGIEYIRADHNSAEAVQLLKEAKFHLGVILGARILSQEVINCFSTGILNIHPGLLPENRGLDNIKWAIVDGQPQGVTAHLIDHYIDRGELITRECLMLENGFSKWQMVEGLHLLGLSTLTEALNLIEWEIRTILPPKAWGENRGVVTRDVDDKMPELFKEYTENYDQIISKRRINHDGIR